MPSSPRHGPVPAVPPVDIRLVGTPTAVTACLAVLDRVFDLVDVSDPHPARGNAIRVYATVSRRHPIGDQL